MTQAGVDLLRDELLRVDREHPPGTDTRLRDAIPTPEPPATAPPPCELCHERPGVNRCLHCERRACRDHYWVMLGLCKGCATEDEMAAAREGRHRPRPDLDIKWIED